MIDPRELSEVLDSILEGLQVLGPDWRYLHVNDVAARHGKTTKDRLIGRSILECYPGIEKTPVFAAMRRCMDERTSCVLDNEFTYPDGTSGSFELRIAPVPQGICVLSLDVTARREAEKARHRAEERLRNAQRMESVGLLASGIAHDFNNLLTVILSQGEIALSRDGGPAARDVETMVGAARSAAGLTRQLLAYGRRSVLHREIVSLGKVLEGLTIILLRSLDPRIQLVVDTTKDVPMVDVDRTQLEQVVLNLVLNARDAIPGNGRITVALDSADFDSDHVLAHPDAQLGPHSVLIVSDTGVGMDSATQARIFEPFFTTKDQGHGTGLGLATVYGIVRQHGGSIRVRSAPGAGTTFEVYFPCAIGELHPVKHRAPAGAGTAARGAATILVVDDQPEIAELVRMMLVKEGHRVLLASTGDEAIDHWAQGRAGIDLLVTDFRMPGMSGSDLIRKLRADAPGLPVLCTSAHALEHIANDRPLADTVSFLEKPFTRTQIVSIVAHLLAGTGK